MKRVILIFIILFSTIYTMPVKGDRVDIRNPVDGNLISASERLTVNARVEKSIISASKFLDVNKSAKNIIAAASEINVLGDIDNILVSASRKLAVNGDVGGSIVVACESLLLNGNTGDVVVAAREVDVNGELDNLFVAADKIYISGTVRGNVYSTTNRVELIGDGEVLGEIYHQKEAPKIDRREIVKKSYGFIQIVSIVHSFLGIFVITFLLKKLAPDMEDKLSKNLFNKGLLAFFIGIFFLVTFPIFVIITMPIFGVYSFGIMLGYLLIIIFSKSFLVLAISKRYNYFLSIAVVVSLSFFYPFSLIFSIIGFGIFLIFVKDVLSRNPELEI
ncbi:polymer-forming cytoskeletal protein [Ilyobacter polytropus]|uniref:Polymer-forming cytoskeletal protein n=1 Tax=Ilyobacter polytropus (strain ATCC 51220 / DSM 2926 / LMG 16218 / CuHBu1) TaxID=572544 RepID=E3HCH9_ILYPC|nr:polymer-forming cytoskeletal protein [Ilyobacter polytropus]ADO83955.1 hypothetical protein Ilyop_2192 [Ilyobacter polytropus DSM 2926]